MAIFGLTEPVVVGLLLLIVIFFKYVLPMLFAQKSTTDYSNFDWKNSNAFNHFGGVGGPGYHNLKLKDAPTIHGNGKASFWLEGLPRAFTDVVVNPMSPDCNFKIKMTADAAFGTRVDVYWNVDANGSKQQWDNLLVQNWDLYSSKLSRTAKVKSKVSELVEKEFNEELKGISQPTSGNLIAGGALEEFR